MEWCLYSTLSNSVKNQIEKMSQSEFDGSDFLKRFEPAVPGWTLIEKRNDQLSGFIHALARNGTIDGHKVKLGGLMNLVVAPHCRKTGIGKSLFTEGIRFLFELQNVDFYIGFPSQDWLFSMYNRLGCSDGNFKVRALARGKSIEETYHISYFINNRRALLKSTSIIDLCGNPW
jgi:hypothetical protein